MVARSVPPEGAEITYEDAAGLTDAYIRLRDGVRSLATDLGMDGSEFDAILPGMQSPQAPITEPRVLMELGSTASHAATLLRALAGYVEGLIEAVVLEQQLTMGQVQAAREAARQPPGFR
jgi:hypothetical protein